MDSARHDTGLSGQRARPEAYIVQGAAFVLAACAPLASRASVPVLFITLVALVALHVLRRSAPVWPKRAVAAGPIALIVWAAVSASWSFAPAVAVLRPVLALGVLVFAGLILIAWAGAHDLRAAVARGLFGGVCLALLIYVFEAISWGWLTRLAHGFSWRDVIDDAAGGTNVQSYLINGTAILSLLLWPMLASLRQEGRIWLGLALAAAIAVATIFFGSDAGLIALVAGAASWFAAARWGQTAVRIFAALFVLIVLATPFAIDRGLERIDLDKVAVETKGTLPSSALLRLYIWKFAADKIMERPLLGWGFDSARSIPGGGDKFTVRDGIGNVVLEELRLPLHPHNQILQIWLELGAVGAIIVALAGGLLIVRIGQGPVAALPAGLALAATILVYDALSFGAWQNWWVAAVLMAVFLQSAQTAESK